MARELRMYVSTTTDAVWTDISGELNLVESSGGNFRTEEVPVASRDVPVIRLLKPAPVEVAGRVVYSSTPAVNLRALKDEATPVRLCWAPSGLAVGNLAFLTAAGGVMTQVAYAGASADDAGPLLMEFRMRCAGLENGWLVTATGTDDVPVAFWGLLTETGEPIISEAGEALIDG